MKLIDGKAVSAEVKEQLAEEVKRFVASGLRAPALAVILVGDDPASAVYVRNKKRACEQIGIISLEFILPAETEEDSLLALIDRLNSDDGVDGILVQMPLPPHIDAKKVIEAISPDKDVDAFHPYNVGLLNMGTPRFLPCTPAGVMRLLSHYGISVAGKDCVVVGRSNIVGKPMSALLLAENATVTVCHSKTKSLESHLSRADVVIAAVGRAEMIGGECLKEGAVVIDVGINRTDEGLKGDCDFDSCSQRASYITPVPGGVGPMTIAILMENTVKSFKYRFAL